MRFCLIPVLCAAAWAQNGKTILRRVADTYRTAQSYHYTAAVTSGDMTDFIEVYFQFPNMLRVVSSAHARSVVLNDRYEKVEIAGKARAVMSESGGGALTEGRKLQVLGQFGVSDYREIDRLTGASVRRHEALSLSGDTRDCFVVETEDEAGVKRTYWIDAERNIVLQEVDSAKKSARTLTLQSLNWNEPLDQSMFVIDPPGPSPTTAPGTAVINGKVIAGKDLVRTNWRIVRSHFPHQDGVAPPSNARVTFPKGKTRSGSPATIALKVTVGSDGVPAEVDVIGNADKKLAKEAIDCVHMWRFTPAQRDGQPISASGTIELGFMPRPFVRVN